MARHRADTPAGELLLAEAVRLAREQGLDVGGQTSGGMSDGCWTAADGVPTLDGLGPVGGLDHSPSEYIQLDSVPPALRRRRGPLHGRRQRAARRRHPHEGGDDSHEDTGTGAVTGGRDPRDSGRGGSFRRRIAETKGEDVRETVSDQWRCC